MEPLDSQPAPVSHRASRTPTADGEACRLGADTVSTIAAVRRKDRSQTLARVAPGWHATLDGDMSTTAEPSSTPAASLNALIEAVAAHRDKAAFASLFTHFAPRIKAYLMRLGCDGGSAEELTQEAMVTLWRRAETFDARQANASTWVFAIARNKRIDALRRQRRPELDPQDPALTPDAPAAADALVESVQDVARVRAAIGALPEEQRLLLQMAYYEDKPHSVIAEEQGLPLGTVKSRIRLAVTRLRKVLKES
jgi:RNA polymerase sigma-70 factor (ECF subfamily)